MAGRGILSGTNGQPVSGHLRTYSYVTEELPKVISPELPSGFSAQGSSGHSMGGHVALTIALKNPDTYKSVSAFAPIVNPIDCPWGKKAFATYLGADQTAWQQYDACELLKATVDRSGFPPILIDQGAADNFLFEQLKPQNFVAVCEQVKQPLRLRMQPGYDHSYFFISSFIEDHLRHHAGLLQSP